VDPAAVEVDDGVGTVELLRPVAEGVGIPVHRPPPVGGPAAAAGEDDDVVAPVDEAVGERPAEVPRTARDHHSSAHEPYATIYSHIICKRMQDRHMGNEYRLDELARQAGVASTTVRLYQNRGLL